MEITAVLLCLSLVVLSSPSAWSRQPKHQGNDSKALLKTEATLKSQENGANTSLIVSKSTSADTKKKERGRTDWKKAYLTIREVIMRTLLIGKFTLGSIPVGHSLGIFTVLVALAIKERKQSIWDQVVHRVDAKVSRALSMHTFDGARNILDGYQEHLKAKHNKVDSNFLAVVMGDRFKMLAFRFSGITYNEMVATLLPSWMYFMVTTQWEMISKPDSKADRCTVANELATVKRHALASAKYLFRKRYEYLKGTYYQKYSPDWCSGGSCLFYGHLTFFDSYNEGKNVRLLSRVSRIFDNKKDEMVRSLMRVLIEPVNAFFNQSICGEGCPCPKNITKKEINFEYPRKCFGKIKSGSYCTLPCAKYGYTYLWCPYLSSGRGAWRYNFYHERLGSRWDYCDLPNWDECMPHESLLKEDDQPPNRKPA